LGNGVTLHLRTELPEVMQLFFFGFNSERQRVRAESISNGSRAHANADMLTLTHTPTRERHDADARRTLDAAWKATEKAEVDLADIQTRIEKLKEDLHFLVVRSRQ
jgi:hypothetical protein